MVLSDLGAEVARIARPAPAAAPGATGTERMISGQRRVDPVLRGRRNVAADLKDPVGRDTVLRLVDRADVLVEGYRPGAAERLGVGPGTCLERNPRLVYARMTGWGQDGPLAQVPGHDINYVALTGTLDLLRRSPGEAPAPPLNLLGDYGGGGMLLVTGILAALVERSVSGKGQVVDAAMTDGVALLTSVVHGMRAEGLWGPPGTNVLDLGAPFYNVYETADGRHLTIGCGEPQFYATLLTLIGLPDDERAELLAGQSAPGTWPDGKAKLAAVFKSRTLAAWRDLLEGTDTCFAPVLTLEEAAAHPHNAARATFVTADGVTQPAPAPRFSRSPAAPPADPAPPAGPEPADIGDLLREWEA
jgi:alpha-methylacyl-CoA racemase